MGVESRVRKLFKQIKQKNKRGFTIIELMTVVIIIMALVAVAAPIYGQARQQAKEIAFDSTVRNLKQAAEMYLIDGGGDAIWAPEAGQRAGEKISGSHEGWYEYLEEWPPNPLETGDFIVTISEGVVTVSPDGY